MNISDEERERVQSITTEERDAYRVTKQAEMWNTWTNSWTRWQDQSRWKKYSVSDLTENAIRWTKFDASKMQKKWNAKKFSDEWNIKNLEAVKYLQKLWIIKWYDDWTFWADNSVNRAEAVKIILEALWEQPLPIVWDETWFVDVSSDSWFAWYVTKAKEEWIIKGYDNWTFWATKTVNKVELLKMLFTAFGIDLSNYEVTELYSDASSNAWFALYLQYAKDNSLINADENWNINPWKWITRDEFSEVVYRLLQQQEALNN